ncbi:hypothetical protein B0H16DRAFT_1704583 [Mycena metata]|uniref:Uncharacterized protein n=1 Tax=Mycena metata TaxID=1033252 RepID=A0AAD7GUN1_9AGAR|nr:hypothetical protein B0H16DRAFT_1704583 [Mycena metata]
MYLSRGFKFTNSTSSSIYSLYSTSRTTHFVLIPVIWGKTAVKPNFEFEFQPRAEIPTHRASSLFLLPAPFSPSSFRVEAILTRQNLVELRTDIRVCMGMSGKGEREGKGRAESEGLGLGLGLGSEGAREREQGTSRDKRCVTVEASVGTLDSTRRCGGYTRAGSDEGRIGWGRVTAECEYRFGAIALESTGDEHEGGEREGGANASPRSTDSNAGWCGGVRGRGDDEGEGGDEGHDGGGCERWQGRETTWENGLLTTRTLWEERAETRRSGSQTIRRRGVRVGGLCTWRRRGDMGTWERRVKARRSGVLWVEF